MLLNGGRKRDISRIKRAKFPGITADKLTGNSVVLRKMLHSMFCQDILPEICQTMGYTLSGYCTGPFIIEHICHYAICLVYCDCIVIPHYTLAIPQIHLAGLLLPLSSSSQVHFLRF